MTFSRAVPPHAVERPELGSRLDAGVGAPLTLVVASAGSGKTVLLAQWAASIEGGRVAWLDMSPSDDDAVMFARRLVAELASVDPALGELDAPLGNAGAGLGDPMLEALAAAFADLVRPIIVIFDDLHRVTNSEIVTDLWRLVDMLPAKVHFVFSSRSDLKLGWSRHRLQHGIVELRQSELAFDTATTARVLERICRVPVDAATAAAVVARTEGWAAGVQLTGLSLRFRTRADEVVAALADSDRLAIDYLSEEVLDGLAPDRTRALLQLSVLDELSPGLVEAVADLSDGGAFLKALERESLFVVSVPGTLDRYRFHPLFRDLLRYRLRENDAAAEARLLVKAGQWQLGRGEVGAAIESFLAAREWSQAMDHIVARGRDVYERGDTATVARWLSLVPSGIRSERAEANVLYGILEGMSGQAALGEEILRGTIDAPGTERGVALVARAFLSACVQFRPHPEIYLAEGRRFLEEAESSSGVAIPDLLRLTSLPLLEAVAKVSIGRAQFLLGDLAGSERTLRDALELDGSHYGAYRVHLLGSLALSRGWSGRLRSAAALSDEGLELARDLSLLTHPSSADAYLARALVAIQRGEPESGAVALHEGYVRAAANRRTQLMWIAHAQSRLVDPQNIDAAAIAPPGAPPPIVEDVLAAITRRMAREAGHPTRGGRGTRWAATVFEDIAGLLAEGDLQAARTRLDAVTLPDGSAPATVVEVNLLRAWLESRQGRPTSVREHLQLAVDTAAAEHLIHPFIRAGTAVSDLIDALPGAPRGFRLQVLTLSRASRRGARDGLAEPLTPRELDLLAYLPSRMTNAELAALCFVSVNTVKTHMAHIYRKLDATGRDAAIVRARELGLLETPDVAHVG
ncbi:MULTISPECIES: LuxR C-terminal-related transcriptional regulator [unclassified Microbacterium]|uniref:LuxR C-terminal-related transcriptional regulator n=1 Tax=unclassified Microbacterium TaxID=2609290 RepID=UPI00214BE641|nr:MULTISPECIES: LuxR C-terminal-related transcriptional regulator [unclassified Microbacterium]MCR2785311.1 LuxR C-terminal-related transcriptional regulator [Microbacterium sp. zg.B96]WIM16839.1 LuxR C-terminal-related transcriptional regulator [Microbacterium sp. zg-B96]